MTGPESHSGELELVGEGETVIAPEGVAITSSLTLFGEGA